jgi:hypothetical protein
MARVHMLKETRLYPPGDWQLCFQWCRYDLDEEGIQFGYRFIWRRPDGDLQAARGQARIPSITSARGLMDRAVAEGWGDRDGDAMLSAAENLRARGYVVELGAGYVGYRNRQASDNGRPTPEEMEWSRMIVDWS